jgi:hypothetical protein
LLWDDNKRSNCPGRAGFAKARYMKSFPIFLPIWFFSSLSHADSSFVGASDVSRLERYCTNVLSARLTKVRR